LDLGLPDSQGLDTLGKVHHHAPDVPVIVLTANNDEELAVRSAQEGACEYLVKSELQESHLRRTIRHVFERDRSERALRASEQQLRAIIESTPQCIKVVRPDGVVLKMNAAGLRMLEAERTEDIIGQSFFPWIAPEYREAYLAYHNAVCRGERGTLDFEIIGRKGTRRSLESVAVPLPGPDGSVLHLALTHDVTERKKADAELKRTGDLLRALADGTSDAVFVKDLQGRYLLFNPAAANFVGKTVEEVLGRDDRALFDSEDARRVMANDRRVVESAKAVTTEEVLTAAGVTRTFLATKTPYRDAEGKVIGVLGIARDISDRKRLEAERDRVTARLRLQVDRMPLACLLFDAEFRIVDWNPAAEIIFGFSREEVLGMEPPYEKILPAYSWPAGQEIFRRIRAGDMAAHSVNENLTRDGRTITCEWHNTPLFEKDGAFLGLLSLARDVTRRHETERALELRDRAIQTVSQGIVITDANQPDNPIIYASPSFERLTGYTQAEVLGKNCRFMQGKDSDPETVSRLRIAIAQGEPCTVELLNYRRDGTPLWIELRVSPIRDERGRLTHFVGTQADMTDRRALESQLRQSQKMEAVGQLAGGIAHDFNNLLTIIIGSCDLLKSNGSPSNSALASILDIRDAAGRATSLTRQLLAFSRKQILDPVVLNLNEVIKNINKMLLRLVGEDIELTASLFPAIWPVRLDPGQIEQVIVNLVVNARDAMPNGGRLMIVTSNVEWSDEDCRLFPDRTPGRYARIAVADSGSGMTQEIKNHIFEPFFTTKGAGKGTGLGLAVVHGIVKQSDGFIDVNSEVGVGTLVTLFFPAVKVRMLPPTIEQDDPPEKRGSETILLVEDEDGVRRLAQLALERQGYTVLDASNGRKAIEAIDTYHGPLHLIITDVVMPGMNGRELVEILRTRFPNLKALYMSGYTDDAVLRRGIKQESQAFLQKPFSPADLVQKVQRVLADGSDKTTSMI
jgi:PAS domain S-box-containing protein